MARGRFDYNEAFEKLGQAEEVLVPPRDIENQESEQGMAVASSLLDDCANLYIGQRRSISEGCW